ncbi:MAG: DoxX family membrane protein [Myxococcota bacterium]|nr:DoxX family membrane protein [Myxococcota bacterium]
MSFPPQALDPVLLLMARLGLATLFLAGAVHKLRNLEGFAETVRDYRILPPSLSRQSALGLATAEAGVAVCLLLPGLDPLGSAGTALLLALYSGAIGLNLARGRRHIDCGCMGFGRGQSISGWLLARNGCLVALAFLLLVPAVPRAMGWVDLFSISAGLAMTALLWLAAHGLSSAAISSTPTGEGS